MTLQTDMSPSEAPFSITPNDGVDLTITPRAVIIASAGTMKVTKLDGTTDTLTLPAGIFPMRVRRIWATGTTATGISGLV